jgi:hypothetical protein
MTIKARQLAVKANKTHSARQNPFRTDRQDDNNTSAAAEPSIRMARAPEDQGANMTVDEEITAAASEAMDAEVVEEAVEHRPDSTSTMEALPVPVELRREARISTNTRGNAQKQRRQRIDDQCSFCGYGPHNPKHCFYLQEVPDCD